MSRRVNWTDVRQLFHEALAQPSDARDAFVSAVGSYGTDTRNEVRALLAAHDAAGPFLESPAARPAGDPSPPPPALGVGDRVGRYEIVGTLGAGGMGEVYRARDVQLERDVALKILPPAMAGDPNRLARFERESRVLAALDHPNVATIHSVEHIDGLHLLVLQLVEGPTLAERLAEGPLPVAEALNIATQLTRALEAAHGSGIVHRDLKPANVKVSNGGHVTLLDFGLAKEPLSGASGRDATVEGVILGTWGYMSPEQARGLPADKRTDIWAFGCILYELLAGRPAFGREHASDSIAAILERQPDWTTLPPEVPARIRHLLRRLLEKDRDNRLHDIADARLELVDAVQQDEPSATVATDRPGRRLAVAAVILLCVAALAIGWWLRDRTTRDPAAAVTRFAWTLPPGMVLESAPALSPDGRRLAFAAVTPGAPPQLYVRHLGELDSRPIPGSQFAEYPFWSPDSRAMGFFARGVLMRVALDGGVPVKIAPTSIEPKGGTWGRDGTIVYTPAMIETSLWRVPAAGGTPEPATVLALDDGDNAHRWPAFLPDGIHFVYFVRSRVPERRGVYLGRVDGPAATGRMLFRSESEATFDIVNEREGLLVNASDDRVDVRRLDLSGMTVGDPEHIAVRAGGNTPHQASMLSVGAGVLAFADIPLPYGVRQASVQLSGEGLRLSSTRSIVNWPRLSPDGTKLASARLDPASGVADLWVDDLTRGTRTRVTDEHISARLPVWSSDGSRLAYVSGVRTPSLRVAAADGTGVLATIPCRWRRCEPTDWSTDGRWLVVQVPSDKQSDVWLLPLDSGADPRPLLTAEYVERDARMSPDGQLLAYVSQESGRAEVSVRNVEGTPHRVVISPAGGSQPVWARDGRTLGFVDPEGHLALVPVRRDAGGRLLTGVPNRPPVPRIGVGHGFSQYDLALDGRVHFIDRQPGQSPAAIGLIAGWRGLLD